MNRAIGPDRPDRAYRPVWYVDLLNSTQGPDRPDRAYRPASIDRFELSFSTNDTILTYVPIGTYLSIGTNIRGPLRLLAKHPFTCKLRLQVGQPLANASFACIASYSRKSIRFRKNKDPKGPGPSRASCPNVGFN